jgi:hypothetical protein
MSSESTEVHSGRSGSIDCPGRTVRSAVDSSVCERTVRGSRARRALVYRGAGFPRAGAGKILPRPRRTVGGEKAGRPEPYTRGAGRQPRVAHSDRFLIRSPRRLGPRTPSQVMTRRVVPESGRYAPWWATSSGTERARPFDPSIPVRHPRSFRPVHDLGCVHVRCPRESGES